MTRPFFLLLLALAGCGALGNRLGPEKLSLADLPKDAAVVIISAGAAERCMQAATFLHVYPADKPFTLLTVITSFNVDGYAVQSDFPTHQGSLSVLQLKPGRYSLVPVMANPNVTPVKTPKADITLEPGEIVYLGEYWMSTACAFSTLSGFRNQEERDMALLKQKNPAFANVKITKRIARFTGYAAGGDK